jgi:hypothetical protein
MGGVTPPPRGEGPPPTGGQRLKWYPSPWGGGDPLSTCPAGIFLDLAMLIRKNLINRSFCH